jgi:zinc transport system substrate-binding protein
VVFHDAYQYLERRYGLRALGSILVDPDRAASARHLEELRELIADRGAACVFAEPQFDPGLASALVEGTGARLGVLDQLGASAAPGSYEAMLRALGAALVDCLSRPSPTDP